MFLLDRGRSAASSCKDDLGRSYLLPRADDGLRWTSDRLLTTRAVSECRNMVDSQPRQRGGGPRGTHRPPSLTMLFVHASPYARLAATELPSCLCNRLANRAISDSRAPIRQGKRSHPSEDRWRRSSRSGAHVWVGVCGTGGSTGWLGDRNGGPAGACFDDASRREGSPPQQSTTLMRLIGLLGRVPQASRGTGGRASQPTTSRRLIGEDLWDHSVLGTRHQRREPGSQNADTRVACKLYHPTASLLTFSRGT